MSGEPDMREQELDLAALEGQVRHAERFLRAGGKLELGDWLGLSPVAQLAFTLAGDRLRRRQAAETGLACHSRAAALELLPPDEGGPIRRRSALQDAVRSMASERRATQGARP